MLNDLYATPWNYEDFAMLFFTFRTEVSPHLREYQLTMAESCPLPAMDLQTGLPLAQGLYSAEMEKDACGVGFIVNIHGIKSKKVFPPLNLIAKEIKALSRS